MSLSQGMGFFGFIIIKHLGRKCKYLLPYVQRQNSCLQPLKLIGNNWANEIHFYRFQDDQPLVMTHQTLLPTLNEACSDLLAANIVNITLSKIPLVNLLPLPYSSFAHHAVIIIETDSHYFSIEKTTTVIKLQQQLKDVDENASHPLAKYLGREEKVNFVANTQHTTVCDLITYLHTCQSFHQSYNVLFSNCQHFAKQILQGLAANPQVYKPFPQIF